MAQSEDKKRIITEFEIMQGFELAARDFYRKAASDPLLEGHEARSIFADISEAEQEHADIVREIIDIVNNAL